MNSRERFLATMRFEPVDRGIAWEWHFMPATVARWHAEGLPDDVYLPTDASGAWVAPGTAKGDQSGRSLGAFFGLEKGQPYCQGMMANVPLNTGMLPGFRRRILHDSAERRVFVDAGGVTQEVIKGIEPAMPRFLDYPVHNREEFEALERRYDASQAKRFAPDWSAYRRAVAQRDCPLSLRFDGLFGRLRRWMGTTGMMYTLYDEPKLFEAMCAFHTEFLVDCLERTLSEVAVDYANIWEDMAYKNGPLISPTHVRRYMLPGYRRIVDCLRQHGVDIVFVDSDGNCDELISIWLEAGINGLWPLEVAAGSDALRYRREYGRDLLLVGGIDKRELSKGIDAVRQEVLRQVPAMLASGGYVPTVDHSVPPDVPFENYVAYHELLSEVSAAH